MCCAETIPHTLIFWGTDTFIWENTEHKDEKAKVGF